VRQLARKSAFNARAREESVIIIDSLDYAAPKTSQFLALLASLGIADRKVLFLTDGVKPNVFLSSRNVPTAHVMPYSDSSTYHILWSDVVVIEASALGGGETQEAEKAPARKPRTRKAAPAAGEE
jgi:large subunit ribosomal protein L4